ncbi:MAG: 2Fe-2S iron-sulfur cluster binding domain-containing protein [Phycisphaerales bacterium]|nr:2Fe-2S iron-sulfur cluster binding domain-containing protein [Phycisphaerales bacterium]
MHVRPIDPTTATVTLRVVMEDPHSLTGCDAPERTVKAHRGMNILEACLASGINIEHACGGVCACSTCHVYVEGGAKDVSEPSEAEEDRVEEAPGLQRNSRLSCQCELKGDGPVTIRVPAWNRNAVKEGADDH